LPLYDKKVVGDTNAHFKLFFQYYKECPQAEVNSFINLLKDYKFILFHTVDDGKPYRSKADNLYFPEKLLEKWFQTKPDAKFVAFDEYVELVGKENTTELYKFLKALGVSKSVRVLSHELSEDQVYKIMPDYEWPQDGYFNTIKEKWIDKYLDGGEEIFKNITHENSIIVWKVLLDLIDKKQFDNFVKGEYTYWYTDAWGEKSCSSPFKSNEARYLLAKPCLLNADGALVSALEVTLQTLSPQYDTSSGAALELIRFLGIKEEVVEPVKSALTDEQWEKMELANDIPLEDLKKLVKQYHASGASILDVADGKHGYPSPSVNIKIVYEWWNKLPANMKKDEVEKYYKSLFPFDYNRADLKNNSNQGKFYKSWFVLFTIAVCQQLGRVSDKQNRGFIEYLDENGWLDTMVTTDDPAGWMNIIEGFFESNQYDQEYNYWFKAIPELYIIRHHFDDYIHFFMNLYKTPENQHYDLQTILIPEMNPSLRGSGIHAPALNRTLKIGASLIIRELLRENILSATKNIVEHAFAPHQRTQEIVFGDTQERTSKEIYIEINKKLGKTGFIFDGYYDIPILLYRENEA
jgi:hypothetical protein